MLHLFKKVNYLFVLSGKICPSICFGSFGGIVVVFCMQSHSNHSGIWMGTETTIWTWTFCTSSWILVFEKETSSELEPYRSKDNIELDRELADDAELDCDLSEDDTDIERERPDDDIELDRELPVEHAELDRELPEDDTEPDRELLEEDTELDL
eukprot:g43916.t1